MCATAILSTSLNRFSFQILHGHVKYYRCMLVKKVKREGQFKVIKGRLEELILGYENSWTPLSTSQLIAISFLV